MSQPETSRDCRDEHSENMPPHPKELKRDALETSQPETSRDCREEQPENMQERSEAPATSQPETPRDCRDEQS